MENIAPLTLSCDIPPGFYIASSLSSLSSFFPALPLPLVREIELSVTSPGIVAFALSTGDKSLIACAVFRPLPWDTAFFGRSMGRLYSFWTLDDNPGTEQTARDLLSFLTRTAALNGYHHITATIDHFQKSTLFLATGYRLVDIAITLEIPLPLPPGSVCLRSTPSSSFSIDTFEGPLAQNRLEDLVKPAAEMARMIFKEGRFYNDPFFDHSEAGRFYSTWMTNLCLKDSLVTFIAREESILLGFNACQAHEDSGTIVLFGVHPERTRQGIASALLSTAINWFTAHGYHFLKVKTQVTNYPAIATYEKGGFRTRKADFTFTINTGSA